MKLATCLGTIGFASPSAIPFFSSHAPDHGQIWLQIFSTALNIYYSVLTTDGSDFQNTRPVGNIYRVIRYLEIVADSVHQLHAPELYFTAT